jgi:hypothetical protein
MSTNDITVLVVAAAALVGLGWYFIGPRRSRAARLTDGVQRVEVTVRGGYRPDRIRVRHPLAAAIVAESRARGLTTGAAAGSFDSITGKGIRAGVGGHSVLVGTRRLLTDTGIDTSSLDPHTAELAAADHVTSAVGGHRGGRRAARDDPRLAEHGARHGQVRIGEVVSHRAAGRADDQPGLLGAAGRSRG